MAEAGLTLIPLSDTIVTDVATFVAAHTSAPETLPQSCTELQGTDFAGMCRLFLPYAAETLCANDADAADVEGCLHGVFTFVAQLDANSSAALAAEMGMAIAAAEGADAELKLRVLVNLFNSLPERKECVSARADVYIASLRHAASAGLAKQLVENASHTERLAESLTGLDVARRCDMYIAAADVLGAAGMREEEHAFVLRAVDAHTNGGSGDAVEHTQRAIVGALRSGSFDNSSMRLLQHPAVQALASGDEKSRLLHQLLEIFARETLPAFSSFTAAHPGFLDSVGLDESQCATTMRLLSLCTLNDSSGEISYAQIAKTLEVDESEVEKWVVNAVKLGLLQAKMDQLRQVVLVSQYMHRSDKAVDWSALSKKLSTWTGNVERMLGQLA